MSTIKQAVGRGVTNTNRAEVKLVQQLLNRHRLPPLKAISEDGISGLETINAIIDFQRIVVKMANPDGRVDPQSVTFRLLSGNTTTSSASMASLPALTATGGFYERAVAVKRRFDILQNRGIKVQSSIRASLWACPSGCFQRLQEVAPSNTEIVPSHRSSSLPTARPLILPCLV